MNPDIYDSLHSLEKWAGQYPHNAKGGLGLQHHPGCLFEGGCHKVGCLSRGGGGSERGGRGEGVIHQQSKQWTTRVVLFDGQGMDIQSVENGRNWEHSDLLWPSLDLRGQA